MPTQKFWVKDLKHADEAPIAERLRALDGVFFAVLNHEDQCAEVEFSDGRVSTQQIRAALAEAGYEAEIAS